MTTIVLPEESIQDAIDKTRDGDVIILSPGEYKLKSTIIIDRNIAIRSHIKYGARLYPKSNSRAVIIKSGELSGVHVQLPADGILMRVWYKAFGHPGQTAVEMEYNPDNKLTDCYIEQKTNFWDRFKFWRRFRKRI